MEHELDLLVIGWGKGGKTLAGTAARAGQRVAIVEASAQMYGGTCINIGCVPTKTLIHDAENNTGNGFDPQFFETAVARRDKLTAAMRAKNFSMLDDLDAVMTITGRATFIGPRRIKVEGGPRRSSSQPNGSSSTPVHCPRFRTWAARGLADASTIRPPCNMPRCPSGW